MNLDAEILGLLNEPGCRLEYGIVDTTSPLKVFVAGSTTSTTCNALTGVVAGDFVAVLVKEGDQLVLGAINQPHHTIMDVRNQLASSARIQYIEADTHVQVSDGGGNGSVSFTRAFTGSPIVQLTNGDAAAWGFRPELLTVTTTGFTYFMGTAGITHRVDWLAVGFVAP